MLKHLYYNSSSQNHFYLFLLSSETLRSSNNEDSLQHFNVIINLGYEQKYFFFKPNHVPLGRLLLWCSLLLNIKLPVGFCGLKHKLVKLPDLLILKVFEFVFRQIGAKYKLLASHRFQHLCLQGVFVVLQTETRILLMKSKVSLYIYIFFQFFQNFSEITKASMLVCLLLVLVLILQSIHLIERY